MTGGELPALDAARARALIGRFGEASVAIVGDVMLDHFLVGRVDRISPEAPVPIVAFDHEEHRVGGAANVAHNVAALGGRVRLVGLIGADAAGERLGSELRIHHIDGDGLVVDRSRPTTTKVRVVTTRNQQVARIDYESDAEAPPDTESALAAHALRAADSAGAIVVSDYLKGAVTGALMAALVARARERGIPLLVDPKIPHLPSYAGATLVTPNHHEAEIATHSRIRSHDDARRAARAFRNRAKCEGVLITRGEHGMWLLDRDVEGHLAATAREVADVTGAGDTVIATLALALAAGASVAEAARLANQAAGIVVGKFGPATVSPAELAQAMTEKEGDKPLFSTI
jgi:D-beta-D-heptose 7-phosphate kinase/D-beta-D-heptose 1-phosphate adenosyltransferase